jgi:hypothetical protein
MNSDWGRRARDRTPTGFRKKLWTATADRLEDRRNPNMPCLRVADQRVNYQWIVSGKSWLWPP